MAYRVLIVDDSPGMRKMIRRILTLTGFDTTSCREAGDGLEALEQLAQEPADLLLTDINMPRMNGEELLRRIAADPLHRRLPVLVISTDRSDERLGRMLALGARGYLTKPFSPEALAQALEEIFAKPAAIPPEFAEKDRIFAGKAENRP
jgi:two-component system, chemotaxis family, chemotaxis protein CheY